MRTPDGMGADRHRERQNMKEARHDTPSPTWDVVAVDSGGSRLFVTESEYTEEKAREVCAELNKHFHDTDREWPENVDRYEVRER